MVDSLHTDLQLAAPSLLQPMTPFRCSHAQPWASRANIVIHMLRTWTGLQYAQATHILSTTNLSHNCICLCKHRLCRTQSDHVSKDTLLASMRRGEVLQACVSMNACNKKYVLHCMPLTPPLPHLPVSATVVLLIVHQSLPPPSTPPPPVPRIFTVTAATTITTAAITPTAAAAPAPTAATAAVTVTAAATAGVTAAASTSLLLCHELELCLLLCPPFSQDLWQFLVLLTHPAAKEFNSQAKESQITTVQLPKRLAVIPLRYQKTTKKPVGVMVGCCTAQRAVQWSLFTNTKRLRSSAGATPCNSDASRKGITISVS